MKKIIAALIICFALWSCGETRTEAKINSDSVKGMQDIKSSKTAEHINIPGTKLYIIPPPGFKVATSFIGLMKDNYTALSIYDLDGGNFYSNAATFSKEEFEKKGTKVFEYKELRVNNFPGKYIFMEGDQGTKAISMVFGDSTFSSMITAIYPTADTKTGDAIKEALQTIYYDKTLKVDPFAAAVFTLDDTRSRFKFAKSNAGLFMYSLDGANKNSYEKESFVTVLTVPWEEKMSVRDVSAMCLSKFEQYGLTDKDTKKASSDPVNGYTAFETEIFGKMNGQKSLIYQLVVTDNEKAIIIQAMIVSDFDATLEEVKKLSKTISLK
jgi:hypothetical protein